MVLSVDEFLREAEPVRLACWIEQGRPSKNPEWSHIRKYLEDHEEEEACAEFLAYARQAIATGRNRRPVRNTAVKQTRETQWEATFAEIQKNQWVQKYGILKGLRADPSGADTRPTFVLLNVGEVCRLPLKMLATQALSAAGSPPVHLQLPNLNGHFETNAPSSFEVLLYLSFAIRIRCLQDSIRKQIKEEEKTAKLRSSSRAKKRRVGTGAREGSVDSEAEANRTVRSPDHFVLGLQWNNRMFQRITFAVQAVVRAWNCFARSLGYRTVEEMVLPYMQFDKAVMAYSAIPELMAMQAPASSFLSFDGECDMTADRRQWDREAERRPQPVDLAFRQFTHAFLHDLSLYVISPETFRFEFYRDENDAWNLMKLFEGGGAFSSRFDNLHKRLGVLLKKNPGVPGAPPPAASASVAVSEEAGLVRATNALPGVSPREREVVCAAAHAFGSALASALTVPDLTSGPSSRDRDRDRDRDLWMQSGPAPAAAVSQRAGAVEADGGTAAGAEVEEDEIEVVETRATLPPPVRNPARGTERRSCPDDCACNEGRAALQEAMEDVCRPHGASFVELAELEAMATMDGGLENSVQLVLTDPPFGVRAERNRWNSDYDQLSDEDMTKTVQVISELLRPGGHVVLFCSVQQFMPWTAKFKAAVRDRQDGRDGPPKLLFTVDPVPLVMVPKEGHYSSVSISLSSTLRNVCQYAVHAVKEGLGAEGPIMMNYKSYNYVPSRFPAFTNVIDNVPRLSPGEALRRPCPANRPTVTGSVMVRPEQKSVKLLQELISRFTLPGDTVVDLFAGTFSTAVAALSLPEHRVFAGTEVDLECFEAGKERLLLHFASVITGFGARQDDCDETFQAEDNFRSDLQEHFKDFESLLQAAKLFAEHRSGNRTVDDKDWTAPRRFPAYQALPPHILNALLTKWGNREYGDQRNVQVDAWPRRLAANLHQTSPQLLLATECAYYHVSVLPSLIKNPMAGKGLFAQRTFRPGEKVGYIYGTLVYSDLSKRTQRTKVYGSGLLEVSVSAFRRSNFKLDTDCGPEFEMYSPDVPHGTSKQGKTPETIERVYIVPAPFCACGYINYARYEPLDPEYGMSQRREIPQPRTPNVACTKTFDVVTSREDLVKYRILAVVATKNVQKGEELYFADDHS